MRSIGLPELLVIFGVGMMLALPAALIALIVWIVMRRRKKGLTTSVRPCPGMRSRDSKPDVILFALWQAGYLAWFPRPYGLARF